MKIRIVINGLSKPLSGGAWLGAKPSCDPGFRGGNADHHEIALAGGAKAFARAKELILAYAMFPESRLRAWLSSGKILKKGATVVQRAKVWFFEIEMANRVLEIFDRRRGGAREAGFSLVSLQGHAEQGVETFMVRQDAKGANCFHIIAWSRAGHWITRLFRPFTRFTQLKAVAECLAYMVESTRET